MQVILIDNHDSFTFNLVELIRESGNHNVVVIKNDEVDENTFRDIKKIIISPGPGLPSESVNLNQIMLENAANSSILGICLGFQSIIEVFGGNLKQLEQVKHGTVSYVTATETEPLFRKIVSPFPVGRYHSWIANKIPDILQVTAWSEGIIMGIRHKHYDIQGLQFHPESFLTPSGLQLMKNWLSDS